MSKLVIQYSTRAKKKKVLLLFNLQVRYYSRCIIYKTMFLWSLYSHIALWVTFTMILNLPLKEGSPCRHFRNNKKPIKVGQNVTSINDPKSCIFVLVLHVVLYYMCWINGSAEDKNKTNMSMGRLLFHIFHCAKKYYISLLYIKYLKLIV